MAFAQNNNNVDKATDLPDTQEILTEDETSMYTEPISTAFTWAKLLYIPNQNFFLGMLKSRVRLCLCFMIYPVSCMF